MPQPSEQQFNEVFQRVIASAPEGLSEDEFNALLDQEVAKVSAPESRISSLDDAMLTAQENRAPGEGAQYLPAILGGAGSLMGPVGAAVGGGGGRVLSNLIRRQPMTEGAVEDAATQGALTLGGGLVGRGIGAAGRAIANRAVPFVRSATKPVWAEVRRRAGIEGEMPAAIANKQAQFILEKGLRKPEQADELVKSLGGHIDEAIAAAEANPKMSPVLDTPTRIPRYLNALIRRVEGQTLPGKDRAAIQNVGRELVKDSPLSQAAPVPKPKRQDFNTPWDETTKPFDAPKRLPESSRPRALRSNVRPSEGMKIVRTKSFYDKDASGGAVAGGKAVERATRDAIKEAVPAARPLLRQQGRAIDARQLLDRSSWRDSNRDTAGMGGLLGLAQGRPLMALLLQGLKEGQLAAGHASYKYGPKITRAGAPTGAALEQALRALLMSIEQEP